MSEQRKDIVSSLLGVGAFLLGMALIVFVFQQAWVLFQVPPAVALGIEKGKPIVVEAAGTNLVWIIVRILILLLMAGVGSQAAKWGIRMYGIRFEWPLKKSPSNEKSSS